MRAVLFALLVSVSQQRGHGGHGGRSRSGGSSSSSKKSGFLQGFCGFYSGPEKVVFGLYKSGIKKVGDKLTYKNKIGCFDKVKHSLSSEFTLEASSGDRYTLTKKNPQQTYTDFMGLPITDFAVNKDIVYVSTFNSTNNENYTSTVWKLESKERVFSVEGIVHRFEIGESGNEFYMCRADHIQPLNLLKKQIEPASEKKVELQGGHCVMTKDAKDSIYVRTNPKQVVTYSNDLANRGTINAGNPVEKLYIHERDPSLLYLAEKGPKGTKLTTYRI